MSFHLRAGRPVLYLPRGWMPPSQAPGSNDAVGRQGSPKTFSGGYGAGPWSRLWRGTRGSQASLGGLRSWETQQRSHWEGPFFPRSHRHCVGRGNTGSLELSQPPAFRLFGFVCFFGLFFFSFFFGLIVLLKSFCPVLFFTRLTMLRPAQRGFLCFCPSTGLRGGLASCCELSP